MKEFFLSHFKSEIFKKIEKCLLVALVLFFSEVVYRRIIGAEVIQSWPEEFGIIFLMCLVLSFAKFTVTKVVIVILFFLTTVGNNIHYHVYQSWINGVNLYLVFSEITEAAHFGRGIIVELLPGIIWGLLECTLFGSLFWLAKKKVHWFADTILYIALILFSCRFLGPSQLEQGLMPQLIYGRAKTVLLATGFCFGHEIPFEIFHLSLIPEHKNDDPVKLSNPLVKNIVLIMGESASVGHVGCLGYQRDTMPFLSELKKTGRGVVVPCYSTATMTVVSLPFFFNMIYRPNAKTQLASGKTNLFRMAKEQGFYTKWMSAQARNQMAMMSTVGKRYIDDVMFPDNYGFGLTENIPDSNLRKFLAETHIEKNEYNFVVLHQRGSHGPYGELLTTQEKSVYGEKTKSDCYDNTLYMTDRLIHDIYNDLCARKIKNWVLIYTSDHGQYVTDAVANQNTLHSDCYRVPLVIIPSPNFGEKSLMKSEFVENKSVTHYRVGCFIKQLLGYDTSKDGRDDVFITRSQITGDAGFIYIKDGRTDFVTPENYRKFFR